MDSAARSKTRGRGRKSDVRVGIYQSNGAVESERVEQLLRNNANKFWF